MKKKVILFLTATIAFSTFLIMLFFGIYSNYQIKHFLSIHKKQVQLNIDHNFKIFDRLLYNIERKMILEMDDEITAIADELQKYPHLQNLSAAELKQIAVKHQADEIYLVGKDGIVFNTSFAPDMNFNLFTIGKDFADFLKSIYRKGKIFHQRIGISNKTGIMNMYLYYSPPRSDYIIETSVRVKKYLVSHHSQEFYDLIFHDLFKDSASNTKLLSQSKLDIVRMSDVSCWSFLHEGKKVNISPQLRAKIEQKKLFWKKKGTVYTLYYLPKIKKFGFSFLRDLIVIISYDFSPLFSYFKNVLLIFILAAIITVVFSVILSNTLFRMIFFKRMLKLKTGLKSIEEGNYDVVLQVNGNDELSEIANDINVMRERIKNRENEIRKREEFNYALFEFNPIETVIVDKNGKILMYNLAVRQNRKKHPQIGAVMYKDFAALHKIDMFAEMSDCIKTGNTKVFTNAIYDKKRNFYITIAGFSEGAIITSREITEQILNRKRIEFLNETLKAIRNVNQLITKIDNDEELIKRVCDSLIQTQAYLSSWIIIFDERGNIRNSVSAGIEKGFSGFSEQIKKRNIFYCCKKALEQPAPVIIEKCQDCNECQNCPLYNIFKERGILTIRLENEDKIYGLFSVSVLPENINNEENISLFQEVAGDISFALKKLELEETKVKNMKAIESSLAENEILLKEVHHRVKNNMQLIISLFRLQMKSLSDDNVREVFRDSLNRVYSMALIHEKLYRSDNMADVDFSDYIQGLTRNLFLSYGVSARVRLVLDIEEVNLNINTAIPLGLIVNEMISNSLKYAFPDGEKGTIKIILKKRNDSEFILSVSDEGIGFPENLDIENIESMGMQLIQTLSKQLRAKLEIINDGGVKYVLHFTTKI